MDSERTLFLKSRKSMLGSSDAPPLMEVSPYRTKLQLYEDKISDSIDETTNYAIERGIRAEPRIRSLFEFHKGEEFEPFRCIMEAYPYIGASLDGRSKDKKRILEIKLSGKEDWTASKELGKIPDKYWPQLQHGLMVSMAEMCYYVAYLYTKEEERILSLDKLAIVEVLPDIKYQYELLEKCKDFWLNHVQKRIPPICTDKDYEPLTGIPDIANEWKRLDSEISKLEERKETLRKQIIESAEATGHKRLLCAGIKLVKQSRAGNINYKSIPELKNVNLDEYRGKSIEYWKFENELK